MDFSRVLRLTVAGVLMIAMTACSGSGSRLISFGNANDGAIQGEGNTNRDAPVGNPQEQGDGTSILDLFRQRDDGTKVGVNRYLWNASLDVLDFLPVQSVDPFTGVIVTGYGTPPGGGRAYRATVYIRDPALEARSLNVAIQTRGGRPVSASTQRAVEDAILTRARQMRVKDRVF